MKSNAPLKSRDLIILTHARLSVFRNLETKKKVFGVSRHLRRRPRVERNVYSTHLAGLPAIDMSPPNFQAPAVPGSEPTPVAPPPGGGAVHPSSPRLSTAEHVSRVASLRNAERSITGMRLPAPPPPPVTEYVELGTSALARRSRKIVFPPPEAGASDAASDAGTGAMAVEAAAAAGAAAAGAGTPPLVRLPLPVTSPDSGSEDSDDDDKEYIPEHRFNMLHAKGPQNEGADSGPVIYENTTPQAVAPPIVKPSETTAPEVSQPPDPAAKILYENASSAAKAPGSPDVNNTHAQKDVDAEQPVAERGDVNVTCDVGSTPAADKKDSAAVVYEDVATSGSDPEETTL